MQRSWLQHRWPCLIVLAGFLSGCDSPTIESTRSPHADTPYGDLHSGFPRDPEGTLQEVSGGILRAGVIHAPPWIEATGEEPSGPEADIVRYLADRLGATIVWERGGPDRLLAMLERRKLHILAGGLEEGSPVMKKVGATRAYATVAWWLVAREGMPGADIDGEKVLVHDGTAAVLVEEAGGIPIREISMDSAPDLRVSARIESAIAKPANTVRKIGSKSYVLAVPPGENGWVVAIDRSIRGMGSEREKAVSDALELRR